ncbi:RNA polymerase sigma factor [Sphingomonas sp. J344]|uniref:RNA polymerase sigma factor n=1 Tax=unclassified Sphingomonas TaxID=196159 RepID=UPI00220436CF|nr:sigma-70 family RNA polymerase sigma factor [Sphingomonas sp. J344]UUX98264.1 sigma-70 family RNA polymerase sigma factor [Sphingomonas sp. J315]
MHRFFARHGARQDAADLVQESFARLAGARAKRCAAIERPEAYLSTIASNLLRDRARIALSRSLARHIPIDEIPLAGHDPIAALEARDQIERLQASLARLSPKTRSIFLAHRRDGMTYKDIANQTGLSVKAVEQRMSKAIAHIDRVLRHG